MSSADKNRKVVCHDKDGNKFEVLASELIMRPSIYGVIIKDDKILLVKQWDGYDFPGGGVDLGETLQEALIREVREETGMNVSVGNLITCGDAFFKTERGNYIQSILVYYTCKVIDGELSIEGIDENEKAYVTSLPEWIPLTEVGNIKFYNSVDSIQIIRTTLAQGETVD